jgi:hypothetical protein
MTLTTGTKTDMTRRTWSETTKFQSDVPSLSVEHYPEPALRFADGESHIDPRLGLLCYGPKSYSPRKGHPAIINVGLIGSAETVANTQAWLTDSMTGVEGDADHVPFPGCQNDRGLFSDLTFDESWIGQFNQLEMKGILAEKDERCRFQMTLDLMEKRLSLLASKDQRPSCVFMALPRELYRKCRVADYHDAEAGWIHRDLRRAFKSLAMKYQLPTQILREETLGSRSTDHPSVVAWNLFTGLYFKAGGFPWGPIGLTSDTCYVGVSFYRPLGSKASTIQTSLIQAFDENGEGLVLRGHDFVWDPEKEGTNSPHLSEEQAYEIVQMVLRRYEEEMGRRPRRMVFHKTSRYWPAEKRGFEHGLQEKNLQFSLVALSYQSTVRLLAENQYPPLRGTRFRVNDLDYLYTTGYIPELKRYESGHVPSPIQIADHIGQDTSRDVLAKEILTLTKMNWNSVKLGGSMPITIRFARLVGDVMREIPRDREPLPNYKFYM